MDTENTPKEAAAQELEAPAATTQKPSPESSFEKERARFRTLIAVNPNYFGNLSESPYQAVLPLQTNKYYEEIGCVGFQPQFNRLEAVIFVKQAFGYSGGVCSNGSQEFVRFYVSYDNGTSWQDLGLTHFTAYDIPTDVTNHNRLEYDVTLSFSPPRKFCFVKSQAKIRAILAWNVPPPPNTPNFQPVWGNIHDTNIQIEPRRFFKFEEVLQNLKIKINPQLATVVDLEQSLASPEPKELSALELQTLYKDKGIEPHRFALNEIQQIVEQPHLHSTIMVSGVKGLLADLNLNLQDLLPQLSPANGSTFYEKLECVGLNPNSDELAGIIRINKPNGYSGDPCTAGSKEYVSFWADFDNNGTFETFLGTTSVTVYDISELPEKGLEYAVFLPVRQYLDKFRQSCLKGPKTVRIRAILSWNVAPPSWNSNYVPIWGNREETLIHITPGIVPSPDTHPPFIETVGGMRVSRINTLTGLANGAAETAGFTAVDSPFGGEVIISGHLAYPTDISAGAAALKYKVQLSNDGGASWQDRTDNFAVGRTQLQNGLWGSLPDANQTVDAQNFYDYREDLTGGGSNALIFVTGNVLYRWQTGGLTGSWKIRIIAKDPAILGPLWISNVVTVRLDNAAPVIPAGSFTITSGGGNCADFTVGDTIEGKYSVSDEHFSSVTLSIQPANGGSFTSPAPLPGPSTMPLTRSYPFVPTTGESNITWKLDTTGLPRCGYVIRLAVTDRTIFNSGFVGLGNEAFLGLCLRNPED